MLTPTRRTLLATGSAALVCGALAACSSGDGGETGTAENPTTILYGWWGSPEKDEAIFAAIDAFNAANPDIVVEGESTPWAGYWDKLLAGGCACKEALSKKCRGGCAEFDDYDDDLLYE